MARGVKGTAGLQCSVEGCHRPPAPDRTAPSGYRSCCAEHAAERNRAYRRKRLESAGVIPREPVEFSVPELPSDLPTIEELRERRRKESDRTLLAQDARHKIPVNLHTDGPIAICVFGDVHIDSPGCDFAMLEEHTRIVSAREAWQLVEWWVGELSSKMLFISDSNHDAWARTINGVDPIEWLIAHTSTLFNLRGGVRMGVTTPSGFEFTVNTRHDFQGRSQFNPAHGPIKAAIFGHRDNFNLAGHTHDSGLGVIVCPSTGIVTWGVRIASYKKVDDYALERGFPDHHISPCAVLMIDPYEPDPRLRTWVEFNLPRAARIITAMREDWQRRQQPPSVPARKRKAA